MATLYTPRYAIPYTDDTNSFDLSHSILKNMVWTIDNLLWENREFVNGIDSQIQNMWSSVAYTRATPSIVQVAPTLTNPNVNNWILSEQEETFFAEGGALPTTVNYNWWYEWELSGFWEGQSPNYFLVKDKAMSIISPFSAYEGLDGTVRVRILDEIGNATEWSDPISKQFSSLDMPSVISHEWDTFPDALESGGVRQLTIYLNNIYAGLGIVASNNQGYTMTQKTISGNAISYDVSMPDAFANAEATFTFEITTASLDGVGQFTDTVIGNNSINMQFFMSPTDYAMTWYGDFKTFIDGDLKTMIYGAYNSNLPMPDDGIYKFTWDKNSGEMVNAFQLTSTDSWGPWIGNTIKVGAFYYTSQYEKTHLWRYNDDMTEVYMLTAVTNGYYGQNVFERSDGRIIWLTQSQRNPDKTTVYVIEPDSTMTLVETFSIENFYLSLREPGFTVHNDKFYYSSYSAADGRGEVGHNNEFTYTALWKFDVFTWELEDKIRLNGQVTNVFASRSHTIDNDGNFLIMTQDNRYGIMTVSKVAPDLQSYIVYPMAVAAANNRAESSSLISDVLHIGDKYVFLIHFWNESAAVILECDTNLTNWKEWRIGGAGFNWDQYVQIREGNAFYDESSGRIEFAGNFIDADYTAGAFQLSIPYPFFDLDGQTLYEDNYGTDFYYAGVPVSYTGTETEDLRADSVVYDKSPDTPNHDVDSIFPVLSINGESTLDRDQTNHSVYSLDVGHRFQSFSDVFVEQDLGDGHLPVIGNTNWVEL